MRPSQLAGELPVKAGALSRSLSLLRVVPEAPPGPGTECRVSQVDLQPDSDSECAVTVPVT